MPNSYRYNPFDKYIELPVREDTTLMEFLMKQMSGTSRNHVKDLLSGHAVTVDRKLVTQYNEPLHSGQLVQVRRHRQNVILTNRYVRLIYEDPDLVVIEKNLGILSMSATPKQYSVKNVLDEYFMRRHFRCTAHVVHRLDRETSGLMIYAKSIEMQQILEENWHDIVFDRRYVALVCGNVNRPGGTIRSWLTEKPDFTILSSKTDNGGKEAVTYFRTLAASPQYSLLELKLETGRKNQIRVHMKDIGHPVAGDQKYGNGQNPLGRLALHALRLNFYHPRTGQPMNFDTPIPRIFLQKVQTRDQESDIPQTEET